MPSFAIVRAGAEPVTSQRTPAGHDSREACGPPGGRADYEGADCSSCHDAALQELADAEHAAQDLTSPEHRGKPWTMWGAPKHWFDERNSAMSSDADDELARAEAVYATQVIYSRYQQQLAAARKKQKRPPSWSCIVDASCQ